MTHSDKIKLGKTIAKTQRELRASELNGVRNQELRAELRELNKLRRGK